MTVQQRLQKLERKENIWGVALGILVLVISISVSIALPLFNDATGGIERTVFGILGFAITLAVATQAGRLIDRVVTDRWIKSYFIEDCGEVVKLHGFVRLDRTDVAFRDLLSTRPGLKIIDSASNHFGCTYAAVKATAEDLEVKAFCERHSFRNNRIG